MPMTKKAYQYSMYFILFFIAQVLDDRVSSLLGHESSENRLYAYANDKQTRLVSRDSGLTWETMPETTFQDDKVKLTFTPSKQVPWRTANLYGLSSPHTDYQMSGWGGKHLMLLYMHV